MEANNSQFMHIGPLQPQSQSQLPQSHEFQKTKQLLLSKIVTNFTTNLIKQCKKPSLAPTTISLQAISETHKEIYYKLYQEYENIYLQMYRKELGPYADTGEAMLTTFMDNCRRVSQFVQMELDKLEEYCRLRDEREGASSGLLDKTGKTKGKNKNSSKLSQMGTSSQAYCLHCQHILQSRNIDLQKTQLNNRFPDVFNLYSAGVTKFHRNTQHSESDSSEQDQEPIYEYTSTEKQVYAQINSIKDKINIRVEEIMEFVGEIRKFSDSKFLEDLRLIGGRDRDNDRIANFQTCFGSILELLQEKIHQILKKIKKTRARKTEKNTIQVQVGHSYNQHQLMVSQSQRLSKLCGQQQKQIKKLRSILANYEEKIEKYIPEVERYRLRDKEMEEEVRKTRVQLSQQKITSMNLTKKVEEFKKNNQLLAFHVETLKKELAIINKELIKQKQKQKERNANKYGKRQSIKKQAQYLNNGTSSKSIKKKQQNYKSARNGGDSTNEQSDRKGKVLDDTVMAFQDGSEFGYRKGNSRDWQEMDIDEGLDGHQIGNETMDGQEQIMQQIEKSQKQISSTIMFRSRSKQRKMKKNLTILKLLSQERQAIHRNSKMEYNQNSTTKSHINLQQSNDNNSYGHSERAVQKMKIIDQENNENKNQINEHANNPVQNIKEVELPGIARTPNQSGRNGSEKQKVYRLTAPITQQREPHPKNLVNNNMNSTFTYQLGSKNSQKQNTLNNSIHQNLNLTINTTTNLTKLRSIHRKATDLKNRSPQHIAQALKNTKNNRINSNTSSSLAPLSLPKPSIPGLSKYGATLNSCLEDSGLYSQLLAQSHRALFDGLASEATFSGTCGFGDTYPSLQPTQISAIFTSSDVHNLFLCLQAAIEHEKPKKNIYKDLQIGILKIEQFKLITKMLTLIARLHSLDKNLYEGVRGLVVFPFQSIISQQNYIQIQKSMYNEIKMKECLIRILLLHKGCRLDGKSWGCAHLRKFITRLEGLCLGAEHKIMETCGQKDAIREKENQERAEGYWLEGARQKQVSIE